MAEKITEEEIRKRYLEESKFITKIDDRISFFNGLINEVENAHDDSLKKYKLFFEGMILNLQKSYEDAIASFKASLKLDSEFSFSNHGLGYAYYDLKKYDEAEKCYRKSIALDDKFAAPWIGLGNVYSDLKNYEEAEKCYKKAIALDDRYAGAHYNLALVFYETQNYHEAINAFRRAKELFETEKDQFYISIMDKYLTEIEGVLDVRTKTEETKKGKPDETDPLVLILEKTADYEDEILKEQKEFLRFLKDPPEDVDNNYLQVLRRWNSYTPIIADNYYISKGGGYFLKIKNTGIVIDPGFNFIDNFKGANHKFTEIDYVLISHAHNDHTSDLESIITLLHTYNKNLKGLKDYKSEDTIRAELAKSKGVSQEAISEKEIEEKFIEHEKRKVLNFYISQSVNKKFLGMLDLSSKMNFNIHLIEENDEKTLKKERNSKTKEDINIIAIRAKHKDIISDRHSIGFVIEINGKVLVYTGDTGWSDEIEEEYTKLAEKYKDTPIILLAHLGGIELDENNYKKNRTFEHFYDNHLGRLGLGRLIQVLKPELCIISEFGEEMKYTRKEFAEIYSKIFKETIFLPEDRGLKYNFDKNKIEAITKINIKKTNNSGFKHYEKGYITATDVGVVMLLEDSSLHYYNTKGDFTESNLAQVLTREYNDRVK
ncbi:tetratricopeptide repeat protein [Candidatus Magnetomonas plexicatena]|uniref:tetratricopeptide repeat protein n=1 Tax=Candidatus Magnetomonas plexicatena TaxID=2552947 RepID=UPI0011021499|nr:tetratricopeptide repeat protein [Nitrospirales bacterium LBB_01]